jgi:hypothetical protein
VPRAGAPDIHAGPRLNGLTDGERSELESRAAAAASKKKRDEEAAWARLRERNRGPEPYSDPRSNIRINQAEQECTRRGDILECRDKVR